jgi:ATP-dependent helicase/nuclease subunit A
VYDKLSDGTLAGRPVRYGDCAILLRAMQYKSEQIASVLRRQGVPVHAESRTGFFEATEVRDVIALLQVLDNQRQDIPLATLLRSPLSGIEHPEDAMATAVLAFRDEREPPPFHVAVARYAREQEDDLAHALRRLFTRLEQWRTDARRRPVAELIWSIYESTGYLTYVTGLDGGEQRRANLLGLHERARQFGEFQRQDLARFLEFLASLETEADLGQPSAASEAEDAVRIMSVHGSKGLEFPVVVLPDLGKQFNLSDTYGSLLFDRHAYLGLQVVDDERLARYPSLPWVIVQERIKAQALAEELRVLYVAMTRAREHLILIGTEGNCDSFETLRELYAQHTGPLPPDAVLGARCYLQWLASAAAALEAAGLRQIDVQEHKRDEINAWTAEMAKAGEKSDFSVQVSSLRPLEPAPPPDAAAAQVIERLRFAYPHETQSRTAAAKSVTSIVKPPELREPVLIPDDGETGEPADLPPLFVEDRPLTAADIGTATHVLMQHLDFARAQQDGGVEAQIDELIARHLLSPRDAAAIDRAGVEWFVRSSLGQELASKEDRLHRELPLYFARPECDPKPADPMDLVMIRGRIDLMLREDDGLTVIDYKTDRVDETTIDARADLYRQQLRLYAEALEAISQQKVKAAKLVFLHARKIVTC